MVIKSIFALNLLVLAVQLCAGQDQDSSICYEYIGCFTNSYPYNNTGNILPASPDEIQTKFALFTTTSKNNREFLSYKDTSTIRKSKYNRDLPLKIITHGFASTVDQVWMDEMKDTLFEIESVNVLIVGWGEGAKFPNYANAAVNIRTVAKELNLIVKSINDIFNPNKFDVHCIGHSLGAHLCGSASSQSDILYERISAIDPAGPYFENEDSAVRIDTSDAKFVDAIHTNGGSLVQSRFGIKMPVGHIDFYVNGGEFQPGCPSLLQTILGCLGNIEACKGDPTGDIGCSHIRSYDMYIESMKSSCLFDSYQCPSLEKYENGECASCEGNKCSVMGYFADSFSSTGTHYLSTAFDAPFCSKQYLFQMIVNKRSDKTAGEITLNLAGSNNKVSVLKANTDIYPDSTIGRIFVSSDDYGVNSNVELEFKRKRTWGNNDNAKSFKADKIKIFNLDTKELTSVCQKGFEWDDKDVLSVQLLGNDCRI